MATLSDLYNEIDTHPLTVSRNTDQDQPTYTVEQIVYISDIVENEARQIAITIHIKDRSGGGEAAYYRPKPEYLKVDAFKTTLITKIATYQGLNPDLEEYEFVFVDEINNWAIVKTYWKVTADTELRYYFLWEDGASAVQFRQITNYGT